MANTQALAQLIAKRRPNSILASLLMASGSAAAAPDVPAPTRSRSAASGTVVVGDSLGVGTAPYLKGVKGKDVKVGRSSADGIAALQRMLKRTDADRIVLDLGTNDGSAQELRKSVLKASKLAGGRTVYVPTVNGPNAAQKNAALRRLAGGNVRVIETGGVPLAADGVHAADYRKRAQVLSRGMR